MTTDTNSATPSETEDVTDPQTETVNTTTDTTGETPASTEPTTPPTVEALQAQVARLEAAQKRANAEAAKHRTRASELEKSNSELSKFKEQTEAEKLSEQERRDLAQKNLEKQLADQQAKLTEQERLTQERIINYEVRLQAASLGVKPTLLDRVTRLLDWSEIEYNDDGSPKNVKDLLGTLIKEMPELVPPATTTRATPTSGGATNPPSSQASKQPISWDVIAKLTPAQYDARRNEIQRFMSDPKNHRNRP